MDNGDLSENGGLSENGDLLEENTLRFESLDTGDLVLAHAHATEEGQVALALEHEMDGDLEVFMEPKIAEDLALALARASDEARAKIEDEEGDS